MALILGKKWQVTRLIREMRLKVSKEALRQLFMLALTRSIALKVHWTAHRYRLDRVRKIKEQGWRTNLPSIVT